MSKVKEPELGDAVEVIPKGDMFNFFSKPTLGICRNVITINIGEGATYHVQVGATFFVLSREDFNFPVEENLTKENSPMNPKDKIGQTKPKLGLIPGPAKLEITKALENGAEKYGPYNWREQKILTTTYLDAAERHICAYRDGETNALDSNINHIAHAAAGLIILLDALACDCIIDDRPKSGPTGKLIG